MIVQIAIRLEVGLDTRDMLDMALLPFDRSILVRNSVLKRDMLAQRSANQSTVRQGVVQTRQRPARSRGPR